MATRFAKRRVLNSTGTGTAVEITWDVPSSPAPPPLGYYVTATTAASPYTSVAQGYYSYTTPGFQYHMSSSSSVTAARLAVNGAGGGGNGWAGVYGYGGTGGAGASVIGVITGVTGAIEFAVGGGGGLNTGGTPGGGGTSSNDGAGGGGYSSFSTICIAGGGGGANDSGTGGAGGFMGTAGVAKVFGRGGPGGRGGTQNSGGLGTAVADGFNALGGDGGRGFGGAGNFGGGGGGGYYGGGGGGHNNGRLCGGGGSSLVPAGWVCFDGGGGAGGSRVNGSNGSVSIQELVNPALGAFTCAYTCTGLEADTPYIFKVFADYGNIIPDPTTSPATAVTGTANVLLYAIERIESPLNQSLTGKRTKYANFVITVTANETGGRPAVATDQTAVMVYSDLQTLEDTLAVKYENFDYGTASVVHIDKGLTGRTFLEGTAYISGGLFLSSPSTPYVAGRVDITESAGRSNFRVAANTFDIVLEDNLNAAERTSDSTLTITITDSHGAVVSKTYTIKWTTAPGIFNPAYVYIADSNPNNDPSIIVNSSEDFSRPYKYKFPVTFDADYIVVTDTNPIVKAQNFDDGSTPSYTYGVTGGTGGYLEVSLTQAQTVLTSSKYVVTLSVARTSTAGELVLGSDTGSLLLTVAGIPELAVETTLYITVADRPYTFQAFELQSASDLNVKDQFIVGGVENALLHLTNFIPNDLWSSTDLLSYNNFYDYAPSTSATGSPGSTGNAGVVFTLDSGEKKDTLRTYETMVFRNGGQTGGGVFGFPDIISADTYQIAVIGGVTGASSGWGAIRAIASASSNTSNVGFYHRTKGFVGPLLTVTSAGVILGSSGTTHYPLSDIIAICTDEPSDIGWQDTENAAAKLRLVVMQGIVKIDGSGATVSNASPVVVKSDVYSIWLSDASEVKGVSIDSAGSIYPLYLGYQFPDCLRLDFTAVGIEFDTPPATDASSSYSKKYVYSLQCTYPGSTGGTWYEIATNIQWSPDGDSYKYVRYADTGASVGDIQAVLRSELPERFIRETQERDFGADKNNCLSYRLLLQTQPRFNPNVSGFNFITSNVYGVSTDAHTKRVFYLGQTPLTTSEQYKDYRMPKVLSFFRETVLDNGTFNPTKAYASKSVPLLACVNADYTSRTTLASTGLEAPFPGLLTFTAPLPPT